MRLAIMQPYFLPYIGYFELMNAVDAFVVYDNIQYTKKGWINRNRFLRNQSDVIFTLPLKSDSDFLNVDQRKISENFDRTKLINQLRMAYQKAPYFPEAMPVIEEIIRHPETNLFRFIRHSIDAVCEYLRLAPKIVDSSTIDIDHTLKSQDKVLAICEAMGASVYINSIGGMSLYSTSAFAARGIDLQFLKSMPLVYPQFGEPFVPSLSILDVMMFNEASEISKTLQNVGFKENAVLVEK